MARHTAEKVMELMSEGHTNPEEMARILELPTHKVRKVFNQIKGADCKEREKR